MLWIPRLCLVAALGWHVPAWESPILDTPDMGIVTAAPRYCKDPSRVLLLTGHGLVSAKVLTGTFAMDEQVAGDLGTPGVRPVLVNGRAAQLRIEAAGLGRYEAYGWCFKTLG